MSRLEPHLVPATRVLLLGIPRILSDILQGLLADEPDLELVGDLRSEDAGVDELDQATPDVVITGVRDGVVPATCLDLLSKRPHTRIIGISPRGGRTIVYELRPHLITLGEVSPTALVDLIRGADANGWLSPADA
jgi:DNA-binding NarL/FixJ family response regulator